MTRPRQDPLALLVALARDARSRCAYADALDLCDRISAMLGDSGPVADVARNEARRGELLLSLGRAADAREVAAGALARFETPETEDARARNLRTRGRADLRLGDPSGAAEVLAEARELFEARGDAAGAAACARDLMLSAEALGDRQLADELLEAGLAGPPEERAGTLTSRADLLRNRLDLAGARAAYEQALVILDAEQDLRGRGRALDGLAAVELAAGRFEASADLGRQAMETFEAAGFQQGYGAACNRLGDVLREAGDLDAAEDAYIKAAQTFEELGSLDALVPRLNLGAVLLARGLYAEAIVVLEDLWETLAHAGRRGVQVYCHMFLLPCMAAKQDWLSWHAHALRAQRLLAETPNVERDAAWAAGLAGAIAARGEGRSALGVAVRSYGLALELWLKLGAADEVFQTRQQLAQLAARGAPVPVGPFDLLEPVGRGASSEVWRARHALQEAEIAVKVFATSTDDLSEDTVAHELAALAQLHHPNIASILDHGRVGTTASAMTAGLFQADQRYLATPFAAHGTLSARCGLEPYTQVRRILLGLLGALAHAHARGVLHLDVKIENVLLDRDPEGWRPRLTDFGLQGLAEQLEPGRVAGTPQTMAPEQFVGRRESFGPWTDLYAVGCVAVQLVQGRPPFTGDTVEELQQAHLTEELPSLSPLVPLPPRFEDWVRGMLAKDPRGRFQRASDAAEALVALGRPRSEDALARSFEERRPPSQVDTLILDAVPGSADEGPAPVPPTVPRKPLLPDQLGAGEAQRTARLVGVGLGLVGLRASSVAGRRGAQEVLWSALCDVSEGRAPRVIVIRGPTGSGVRRMGDWLVTRGHEIGAIEVTAHGKGRNGFVPPWALQHTGRAWVVQVLTSDTDALEQVLWALGEHVPALVLVPVMEDQATQSEVLPSLLERPETTEVRLGPMDDAPMGELLSDLIKLEPALRRRIVARARGNPGYAIALLDDLVRKDKLAVGRAGFVLQAGAALGVSQRRVRPWSRRLDELGRPGAEALSIAAALGEPIQPITWFEVCAKASVAAPDPAALAAKGLMVQRDGAWHFAQPYIRDAAQAWLEASGRARPVHEACARVLGASPDTRDHMGPHLLRAGALLEACDALQQSAERAVRRGDGAAAIDALGMLERTLYGLCVPSADARWAQWRLLRAEAWWTLGRRQRAERDGERVTHHPGASKKHLARARLVLGHVDRGAGWVHMAQRQFHDAGRAFADVGDQEGQARAELGLARLALEAGMLAECEAHVARAEALGADSAAALIRVWVLRARGAVREAEEVLAGCAPLHDAERAEVAAIRAALRRDRGDLAGAERALAGFEDGPWDQEVRVQRALVALARSRIQEACATLARAAEDAEALGANSRAARLRAFALPARADGDAEEWSLAWEEAIYLLSETDTVDVDVAWALEVTAGRARAAGNHGRATAALEHAATVWVALGREREASRVRRVLEHYRR